MIWTENDQCLLLYYFPVYLFVLYTLVLLHMSSFFYIPFATIIGKCIIEEI